MHLRKLRYISRRKILRITCLFCFSTLLIHCAVFIFPAFIHFSQGNFKVRYGQCAEVPGAAPFWVRTWLSYFNRFDESFLMLLHFRICKKSPAFRKFKNRARPAITRWAMAIWLLPCRNDVCCFSGTWLYCTLTAGLRFLGWVLPFDDHSRQTENGENV